MEDTFLYCPWDGKRYTSNVCYDCGKPRHVKKAQWKKILYEKQDFEDTYVDANFLNSLIAKENSKKYEFWTLMDSTSEITFALNSLILYLEVYQIACSEYIGDYFLLIMGMVALVIGYVIYTSLLPGSMRSANPIRAGLLLLGILYTLCPVLATINKNYANDTIYLMAFIFCILHLVFYDYSFVSKALKSDKKIIPDVKSMNFALISSLLLSSRLSSLDYVYCLLSFGFM
jgi:Phosphatidylinositol N-acetylglucosaminyltransferase